MGDKFVLIGVVSFGKGCGPQVNDRTEKQCHGANYKESDRGGIGLFTCHGLLSGFGGWRMSGGGARRQCYDWIGLLWEGKGSSFFTSGEEFDDFGVFGIGKEVRRFSEVEEGS